MKRLLHLFVAAAVAIFFTPSIVFAHDKIAAIGEFGNGVIHPFFTPTHVLIISGLGLFLGQYSPAEIKNSFAVFAMFAILGLISSEILPLNFRLAYAICLSQIFIASAIGMYLAMAKQPSNLMRHVLCIFSALIVGYNSGPESDSTWGIVQMFIGTWLGLLAVLVMFTYIAVHSKWQWSKIGIRVIGSWIIAISVLVLAFLMKSWQSS